MESLIVLILAHLIADFPLQTNLIYYLKKESSAGILLHSGIHALTAFLLTGLRWELWYVWLFLWGTHAITDWAKLRYKSPKQWSGFLVDQLIHILVLVVIALWQPGLSSPLPDWLVFSAFVFAWIPLILMFLWVYAGDVITSNPNPPARIHWMREHLLRTSRLSGYPALVAVLIGLIAT
jgi:hypothetical protein